MRTWETAFVVDGTLVQRFASWDNRESGFVAACQHAVQKKPSFIIQSDRSHGERKGVGIVKKKSFVLEQGLYISWVIALVATLGSLYFSEIQKYIPCTYCWYQRILMYPMVILLGIAAVRQDYKQSYYVLPLSILGMCMSAYHYLVQKTSWFESAGSGCGIIPCNAAYINWLGFISIPFLAFVAFTLITAMNVWIIREVRSVSAK